MSRARNRDAVDALGLLRSDMELLIYEANLGEEDTRIAQLRYLHGLTTIEIAGELAERAGGIADRKTVGARLPNITQRMLEVYNRLPQ